MSKFLIIRFSSIGDIIQCMDVVNGIRNHFPGAEIHWLARADMAGFLGMDERIGRVWAFERATGLKGLLRMARALRREGFDYVYDAHSNIRSNVVKAVVLPPWRWLTGRPRYALRRKDRWKRFLLFRMGINRFEWPFRGVVSYREPLAKWGITNFERGATTWRFPVGIEGRFNGMLAGETVTLVPSANWPMKRWPVGHWQALVRLLGGYRFVVLGGPKDEFCEEIRAVAPERVVNLAGRTTLLESCYVVKASRVVVSGDTGLLHAADMFGTRAIALMGPTAFGFPTGEQVEVAEVPMKCRPCTKDGHGRCRQGTWQRCMVDIRPEEVAARVERLMAITRTALT